MWLGFFLGLWNWRRLTFNVGTIFSPEGGAARPVSLALSSVGEESPWVGRWGAALSVAHPCPRDLRPFLSFPSLREASVHPQAPSPSDRPLGLCPSCPLSPTSSPCMSHEKALVSWKWLSSGKPSQSPTLVILVFSRRTLFFFILCPKEYPIPICDLV